MSETYRTFNKTDKRVWVTICYTDGTTTKQHDFGWVEPGAVRDWNSGHHGAYLQGTFYNVRGEVKSDAAGTDPTIYDTSTTNACKTQNIFYIVKGDNNYYWHT